MIKIMDDYTRRTLVVQAKGDFLSAATAAVTARKGLGPEGPLWSLVKARHINDNTVKLTYAPRVQVQKEAVR